MNTTTILLLLVSIVFAAGVSFYQYIYKVKSRTKATLFLAFLRFITVFGLLLLLINPIISRKTIETLKVPLPIVIDNSSSIQDLKASKAAMEVFEKLKEHSALAEKFEVQPYQFASDFLPADTVDFKGTQTNLDLVAKNLKTIYKNQHFPTVLITDGNQTSGEDYVFSFAKDQKVYPLVVGDTTTFMDLKVAQLNVNKYAFHKNKYPVEVFLNYAGTKAVNATFKILQGTTVLNEQTVAFSPTKKAVTLNVLLPADKVGLQVLKATISSKASEKNTYNNTKNFAVEVIDQKTAVALIADMAHPDLGAIKRAIESNAQRKVTILKPKDVSTLTDYDIAILYQPTVAFKGVFDLNEKAKINTWIITGNDTDFGFLNQHQQAFTFKMSGQKEDYLASYESQFNLFALDNIGFEQLPPLENPFGAITPTGNVTTLLSSTIHRIPTQQPLLSFVEAQGRRSAYLFGENLWKWRADHYVVKKSFVDFDVFLDKTIQYLASNNARKSLVVTHERFYNSGEEIAITAQYFNKNYELDEKARLAIAVTNTQTKQVKNYDLVRSSNAFKVSLDGLVAGHYTFTVKESTSNSVYSSGFEVLDFDIEKQFVNPDWNKLNQLAAQTKGNAYLASEADVLIKQLLADDSYKAVQKTIVKKTPLLDWVWLLVLLIISLAAEWFVRKYHGLL